MKMADLAKFDIPAEVIGLWQGRESGSLLPLQEAAVKRHGLFDGGNLLIQAPTSAGKTFIGEMAAVQTALQGKRVVYLAPIKALAEEKYADFREKYDAYGMKVIVSTRDRREFDADLESGSFSIAVVVYEKLEQLLVRRPERIAELALVIADEIEILSDPERGAEAELLLTQVRRAGCRLIGLSAVLGHADKLAEWMDARLVSHTQRPSELRFGVVHHGAFRYRTYNDAGEGEEPMADVHSDSAWEILSENVCLMAERGETCLVFVKSRHESRRGAELLAQRIHGEAAAEAIDALRECEPTRSRDCLMETLAQGVGFHNADLSPGERAIVERAFRRGEIRVMVSTATLAKGLNLPAHNVFMIPEKWRYDSRFEMPWKAPILRGEYENMGGRAGRYGAGAPFGRSILVAPTAFDYERLWRQYVEGERERIEPRLASAPLADHVVRLVAARACASVGEIEAFLEDTLTGRWIWLESLTRDEVACRIRAAVEKAVDEGFLVRGAEDRLEATPFGQAAAARGLTMRTALDLEAWLRASEGREWLPLDLILAAALTEDGRLLQVSLTTREYDENRWLDALKRRAAGCETQAEVPLNRFRACAAAPFYEEVRAVKGALILDDWIDNGVLSDLEERFEVMAGQVLSAADQIGWIVDGAAKLAEAVGCPEATIASISELALRIQHGLTPDALPLVQQRAAALDRNALLALHAHGVRDAESVAAAGVDGLTRWLDRDTARDLYAWARGAVAARAAAACDACPVAANPILVIDDRRPNEILLDGVRIPLQEKQYRMIRVLAAAPGECVAYEAIYAAVWGDSVVEPNQMHFQRRKFIAAVEAALPARVGLIKTIPRRGFMLTLAPGEVRLVPASFPAAA